MIELLRAAAVRQVFGRGFQADLANRGIDWLTDETRRALAHEPELVTGATLQPGETLTVVARPPATRAERKLAEAVDKLSGAETKLARTTRRQRRAARRLRRAQRRLDRRRPGSRRWRRAAACEEVRAEAFDKVMTPSRRLVGVREARARAEAELARRREASLEAARAGRSAAAATTFHT